MISRVQGHRGVNMVARRCEVPAIIHRNLAQQCVGTRRILINAQCFLRRYARQPEGIGLGPVSEKRSPAMDRSEQDPRGRIVRIYFNRLL